MPEEVIEAKSPAKLKAEVATAAAAHAAPPTAAEEAEPAPKEKKDEAAEEAKPAPKEKKDEPAEEAKPAPKEKKDEPPSKPDPNRSGKRVRHAGAQLSYQVFGDRTSKACLFFIHGVEGNSLSFFQNIPHFAKDYFVISFNVRSFGASMMDGDDAGLFEVRHFAGDVLAVLDAEEVTAPVVIIGHSFGGMSTVRMAMENPERVAAIVMSNTGLGFKDEEGADAMRKCLSAVDPKIRIELAVEARPPSIDTERKSKEDRPFTSTSQAFIDKQPVLFSLMGQIKDGNTQFHQLKLFPKLVGFLTGSDLLTAPSEFRKRFDKPVLFIATDEDLMMPWEVVEHIAAQCGPKTSVEFFGERVGHSPYYEIPDKYNETLAKWLKGVLASSEAP